MVAVKPPSKKGQKKTGGKKFKYGTLKKCIVKGWQLEEECEVKDFFIKGNDSGVFVY